jgi:hypothetical protein
VAGQSITFDFLSRGAGQLQGDIRKVGDNTALAARGAKVLADAIDTLGKKEDRTAAESATLAKALRLTGDAEDRVTAKAVAADAAIRRLDDAMQDDARNALEAAAANRTLADSFGKIAEKAGGPSLKGTLAALTPALIPLTGGIAAGVGAIGVSFGAAAVGAGLFGALARSVFSNVSKDNQKLQTAQKQLAAAQIARSQATTKAQRTSADNQIAAAQDTIAAIRSEGAAYNHVLDLSKEIGTKWKVVSAQIASPVLVPWLSAVSKGIAFIRPLVQPVADQFKSWGEAVSRYFSSSAGSAEIRRLAVAFGAFSADQLSALGVFFTDIGKAVLNLGRDLAGHNVDFGAFSVYLDQWGGAFLRWSQSAAARHDVTVFLDWIRANGPVTKDLLKNLGGVLAAFAPGLSGAGTLELRLVTDFLGFLARTPKAVAKPLTEVAGALLLLQKTGVLKVGIKIAGPALKWLSGGVINIGGGAAVGAEIRAAFASGGAAAAAEIRAAMAGGGVAAGGGGLAGAAGSGAVAGKAAGGGFLAAFRAALGPAAAGVIVGALIRGVGDTLSPAGTFAGRLNAQFQADGHLWSTSLLHSFTFGGLEAWLTTKIGQPVGGALNNVGSGAKLWAQGFASSVGGFFSSIGHAAAVAFGHAGDSADALRTKNLVPLQGEVGRVSGGIQGLAGTIQGTMLSALRAAGAKSDAVRTQNLSPLLGEVGRVSGGIQGLQRSINAMHGKTVNVGVHASGSGGMTFTQKVAASISSGGFSLKSLASGGIIRQGTGPTADDVPAMLSRGELVVPAHMVKAGAADNLRGRIPGFAGGGIAGLTPFAANAEYNFGQAAEAALLRAEFANLKKAVAAAAKAKAAAITSSKVPNVGSGVARWKGTVDQALRMEGLSTAFDSRVLYQMQTESGGNPNAINLTDINAQRGDPSRGLMQVIGSTFRAYHWPGTSSNIYDPLANIAAAINYARHVYGPQLGNQYGGIGSGHGYALGGLVPGYASGGVAGQGAAYLKAWQSRHGGPYGLAIGPTVLNQQIAAMSAAAGRARTLSRAGGLSAGQHRFWANTAASESRLLATYGKELTTERAWRTQLGLNELGLDKEIRAAGNLKSLAGPVKDWKAQLGRDKATVTAISKMLGYSNAYLAAHKPPVKPAPPATGVQATHTYGGDVANNLGTVLASALGPFTGAARGGMVFDRGGTLRPGFNPVWNGTGRPEHLVPAQGGAATIRFEVASSGSAFDAFMLAWMKKNVKVKGGGNVQTAFGSR